MCLAIPEQVIAVLDEAKSMVVVAQADRRSEACAALVVPADGLAGLIGAWVLVHTGYVMEVLEQGDALSRLAMFAAITGQTVDDAAIRPPGD